MIWVISATYQATHHDLSSFTTEGFLAMVAWSCEPKQNSSSLEGILYGKAKGVKHLVLRKGCWESGTQTNCYNNLCSAGGESKAHSELLAVDARFLQMDAKKLLLHPCLYIHQQGSGHWQSVTTQRNSHLINQGTDSQEEGQPWTSLLCLPVAGGCSCPWLDYLNDILFLFPFANGYSNKKHWKHSKPPKTQALSGFWDLFPEFSSLEWLRFHSKRLCRSKEKSTVMDHKIGFQSLWDIASHSHWWDVQNSLKIAIWGPVGWLNS